MGIEAGTTNPSAAQGLQPKDELLLLICCRCSNRSSLGQFLIVFCCGREVPSRPRYGQLFAPAALRPAMRPKTAPDMRPVPLA
jgi:hypothetical protein